MDSMFESLIWTRGLVGLACQARRREQDRQLSCLTLNLTPALYPIPGASQVSVVDLPVGHSVPHLSSRWLVPGWGPVPTQMRT